MSMLRLNSCDVRKGRACRECPCVCAFSAATPAAQPPPLSAHPRRKAKLFCRQQALRCALATSGGPALLTWPIMDRSICFDEDCRVRILDLDKLSASRSLQDNSSRFISNMQQLQDSAAKYVATIDQQVERIETEKLRAVGLRNKVAAMHEERRHKQQKLQAVLIDKQRQLDRLLVEEQSLIKVRAEQESLIAKLADANGS